MNYEFKQLYIELDKMELSAKNGQTDHLVPVEIDHPSPEQTDHPEKEFFSC